MQKERERIAIIGIGCRFPGGADSPKSFWNLLKSGVDAISEVPSDRWNLASFYDPDPTKPGKIQTRYGGFLEKTDQFDAAFFGISPREANCLDPQQRILLEVVWESLEDAGQVPEQLAGTSTSVFIGAFALDYKLLLLSESQRELIGLHTSKGVGATLLANRISHWFDFRGSSVVIDTACSSSLVAVHLACQTLWNGECNLALAGGVNVILKPEWTISESKGGFLSPDGRCKAFDHRANGYVRGEGAGVVILKPLSKALEDGDQIYAVIRGSGVNQDGHTQGITVPNGEAQKALMTRVYQQARVSPQKVQYVEAHGTGTAVGDPIEANAIGSLFSPGRDPNRPCSIGSVKTNIGHLEAGAGVAGLIKAALSLKHRQIPPHLHLQKPNPQISLEKLGLRIPQTLEPWPDGEETRFAAVNSFGYGGTNAHVILQEAPPLPNGKTPELRPKEQQTLLLPLSARNSEALQGVARSYRDWLTQEEDGTNLRLSDICYTASLRRGHHDHRLALVVRSQAELGEQLEAFLAGESRLGMSDGRLIPGISPQKLTFVFSGMGPQWWGMGRQLLQEEPVFREVIKECDALLRNYGSWSLWEELTVEEESSRINETQIAQPAIFAIQVALAALWQHWGIKPDAIVGHSLGEVAAAHVAGVLSLEDAVQVIFHRSRLQQQATGQGKMLAVGLSSAEVEPLLKEYQERVSIAAINSPSSLTLSGDADALEAIQCSLESQEIFSRFLRVEVPYHSPKMEPLKAELAESLQGINPQTATVPLFSTVTANSVDGPEMNGAYWGLNMRNPVLFANTLDKLIQAGHDLFLEISPHPVLANSIAECLKLAEKEGKVLPSLRRKEPERAMMLGSFGKLYTLGYPVDWHRLYSWEGRLVRLPSYPWQRERHWLESEESRQDRLGLATRRTTLGWEVNPLLGCRLKSAHPVWDVEINQQNLSYLYDHRVQDTVVYPGAAYVEMALAAAQESFGEGICALKEVEFHRALFLPESEKLTLQLILDPQQKSCGIYSLANESQQLWLLHATVKLEGEYEDKSSQQVSWKEVRLRCSKQISPQNCYEQFQKMGLEYGPYFQGIEELWIGKQEALGQIKLNQTLETQIQDYRLHPTLLDACFQLLLSAVLFSENGEQTAEGIYLPVKIDRIVFFQSPGIKFWSHAVVLEQSRGRLAGNIQLFDDEGNLLVEVQGLHCQFLKKQEKTATETTDNYRYQLQWQLLENLNQQGWQPNKQGIWLIFADSQGIGQQLAEYLQVHQCHPILIYPGEPYQVSQTKSYQIRPEHPEDFERLLNAIDAKSIGCQGIVHLWSIDLPETPLSSLEKSQKLGCGSVLNLIQALVKMDWNVSPQLWLVTQNAQLVESSAKNLSVTQSSLWGFGRVVRNEHPNFSTRLVDLSAKTSSEEIQFLSEQLGADDAEDEIALRGKNLYVHRLVRTAPELPQLGTVAFEKTAAFRAEATYLISGGLGGFGLAAAQWLVAQGARNLVLSGRSETPSAEARAAIEAMKEAGAEVVVAKADVTQSQQVVRVLAEINATMPPLRGIIHAANVYDDAALVKLDWQRLDKVMAPKVIGAWNLHAQTLSVPLDFFLLFSSVTSVVGNPGQGNYAAANAFLDGLAHYRRTQNLPALSINWGAVSDVGYLARSPEIAEHLNRIGIQLLPSQQLLAMLGELLGQETVQTAIMDVNWQQWAKFHPASASSRLSHLVTEAEGGKSSKDNGAGATESLKNTILAAEPQERQQLLELELGKQVAKVLGISAAKLDKHQPLINLGLDSLMAGELSNLINQRLSVSVTTVKLLQGPSIAQLLTQVYEQLIGVQANGVATGSKTSAAPQESHQENEGLHELLTGIGNSNWMEGEL